MSRRVPIDDPSVGAHRPETVAGRLTDAIATNVQHLATLETHMAASWADTLARLDNVVAVAAQVQQAAEDNLAAQVAERVAALETALGITVADPNADPNQPA